MGRIKPAWYYEKQATEAKAREEFYRNRKPTDSTTVKKRSRRSMFYRSLFLKNGAEASYLKVSVSEAALTLLTEESSGLLAELPDKKFAYPIRGTGIKPTMISWYKGAATATAKKTTWGSRWIQYYDKTGDQSHYSLPFSLKTGDVTASALQAGFDGLFNSKDGSKKNLLGDDNGRAWMDLESVPLSHDS